MNYWLVKSEPATYSWHDFVAQGQAVWDGVRNYQARNNLAAMRVGDAVLFYHSVTNPGVVGVARVVREAFQDPTTPDARWLAVGLVPVQALEKPVSLAEIKAKPQLAQMPLVRHSRLSVMPIRPDEFEMVLAMGR